jgi:toxin ParE1/3/4
MQVKVSKEAAAELEEAAAWYEKEQPGLGTRLADTFEHVVQLLGKPNPPLTPVPGIPQSRGLKKLHLHRFPFSVIVVQSGQQLVVIALAHHARKPGYWSRR